MSDQMPPNTPTPEVPQVGYLDLVNQIPAEVAKAYNADICTLFRVSDDRTKLRLEAVYDRGQRVEPVS